MSLRRLPIGRRGAVQRDFEDGGPLPAEVRDGDPRRGFLRLTASRSSRSVSSGSDPSSQWRSLRASTTGWFAWWRVGRARGDAVAGSGFQAPGTDPLIVSVRKAITALQAAGYRPDAMLLTPAAAEALEGLVTRLRPTGLRLRSRAVLRAIFGQTKRASKAIAAPAVLDSRLLGRLYSSHGRSPGSRRTPAARTRA
jgi:hypothetical protein